MLCLLLTLAVAFTALASSAQTTSSSQLPDAPTPQASLTRPVPSAAGCPPQTPAPAPKPDAPTGIPPQLGNPVPAAVAPAVPCAKRNWVERFFDGPHDHPLTPRDKGWLAARNVADPVNGATILITSGIVVAANPQSPWGPGMPGFARNVGVSYAQDMTGEFFGTFLIPSIVHQNPHYHRMPHASIKRRILNTVIQVAWAQSDSGHGMPNYAVLVGYAIEDEIGNLYIPGRETDLPSSATRYLSNLALEPTNNLVSEFLPDIARRVNFQNVVIQRIVNAIARPDSP